MVHAELSHNPYLLLTKVKFNGDEPRINCQIEKYADLPLKDWVDKIPSIFYNEMNGYDFDFYFTGTKYDYEEVKNAFQRIGVSDDQVRLFHKNEIEDADQKSEEIEELLSWITTHPSRRFDFDEFWNENEELFEGTYPFIVIDGPVPQESNGLIGYEPIRSVEELHNTNLSSTPILFYIEESNTMQFRRNLPAILNRSDVRPEQLFFMIAPSLDRNQITRVISDLGVTNPQVVKRYDDEVITQYVRNYPVTEYVRAAINTFYSVISKLDAELKEDNRISEIMNKGIHAEIDALEADILSLRITDEKFVQRDNYVVPYEFQEIRKVFLEQMRRWRNRKTKVVGDMEAIEAAKDYQSHLEKSVTSFINSIKTIYTKAYDTIEDNFLCVYREPQIDTSYRPTMIQATECPEFQMPNLENDLLGLKIITEEDPKTDFLGLFKKNTTEPGVKIRVATCYLEEWRSKALEILCPLIDNLINNCCERLKMYYDSLAIAYHEHVDQLIDEKTAEKDIVTAQLSDDERKLQEDNDWMAEVKNQLQIIERG